MKASDLRAKDTAGLEKEISDLLKAHFGLRMQRATQQLTNHSQLGKTRRDIARARTILAEQERAAATGGSAPAKAMPVPASAAKKVASKKVGAKKPTVKKPAAKKAATSAATGASKGTKA